MQRPMRVYHILALLLYAEYPWITRFDRGVIELKTTPLARLLKCRNESIRDCFRWLKSNGFVVALELPSGVIRCQLKLPKKLLETYEIDLTEQETSYDI